MDPDFLQRPLSHLSIRRSVSFKGPSSSETTAQQESVFEKAGKEVAKPDTKRSDSLSDDFGTSVDDIDISQIGACIECMKAVPAFSQEEIEVGDHIIFAGAIYDHHGIVVEKQTSGGKVRIVEATNTISGVAVGTFVGRKARITISDKELDFNKQKIWVVVYSTRLYAKSVVARRARKYNDENYSYDLLDNNCEHFATYCVTGKKFSIQTTKFKLTATLFLSSGFVGISDERIRNKKEFENKIICHRCYQMNERLLSVDVTPIKHEDQVEAGDIIRYSYWNLWHDAVVLEKKDANDKYVICEIAHYAFCGIFAHRTIKAENLKIDFDGKCSRLEYSASKYNVYEPATVVERARKRIGEQEFVFFSNDSSHYARWCKLKLEKSTCEQEAVKGQKVI